VAILATGYAPLCADLPGFDGKNVFSADEVLSGKSSVSNGLTAIIGGGLVGCETADFLGEHGHRSVIFEMLAEIGADSGRANKVYLMDKLKHLGVEVLTDAKVTKIEDRKVHYQQGRKKQTYSGIDNVVIAMGYCAYKPIKYYLDQMGIEYHDLVEETGDILTSVHRAFWTAHSI
jgi:pyruvate/2-oxoglutarate dehydrogenase complex dihydrolipoamide dehydrogenase (E3) component